MIDQGIVFIYLVAVLIIGLRSGRNTKNINEYAVGKRNFSNSVMITSIFASMVAASCTAGLSGKIYEHGIIFLLSFLGIIFSRLAIAFLIAPRMEKFFDLISAGDIFKRLYGTNAQILMGIVALFEGILVTGAQVLATYQALYLFFGIPKAIGAGISSAVIAIYSLRGGIRAVTATDVFQFAILIIAIPITALMAVSDIGSYGALADRLSEQGLFFEQLSRQEWITHALIFLAMALPGLYPLTIQRMLMAKNTKQIKTSFIYNAGICLVFYSIIGVIGLTAAVLLPNIDHNLAMPALVEHILPIGIRGFVIAGILAIFMSSADSNINVAAIGIIYDICKPLTIKIGDRATLILAKIASIVITVLATLIALDFTNALDIIFMVMVVSNSICYPGLFFGIFNIQPSKSAFWIGAGVGGSVALTMTFGFGLFPLIGMLAGIASNSVILLIANWLRHSADGSLTNKIYQLLQVNGLPRFSIPPGKAGSHLRVRNREYCDIFAILILGNSLLPFFLHITRLKDLSDVFLGSYIASGVFAFIVLTRQFSPFLSGRNFVYIWHILVLLSLPFHTLIMLMHSEFTTAWFMDLSVMLVMLFLLVSPKEAMSHIILGSILALPILGSTGINNSPIFVELGFWSLFLHTLILVACLHLFRQRDVNAYKFMSAKLAHEAGRFFSTFAVIARNMEHKLPALVGWIQTNNNDAMPLTKGELRSITRLPAQLGEMSLRTEDNLKQLLAWMDVERNYQEYSFLSAKDCIITSLSDPAIANEVKNNICFMGTEDFQFLGDYSQISNVLVNIIENAIDAIESTKTGLIQIWIEGKSIFIEDSGTGIKEADLPNIFDDFFSTKGTMGQGLAFCKLVMDQHGGSIECESKKGSFTRFKLSFPS